MNTRRMPRFTIIFFVAATLLAVPAAPLAGRIGASDEGDGTVLSEPQPSVETPTPEETPPVVEESGNVAPGASEPGQPAADTPGGPPGSRPAGEQSATASGQPRRFSDGGKMVMSMLLEKLSLGDLTQRADSIIVGTVESMEPTWNDDQTRIYTLIAIVPDDDLGGCIKGEPQDVISLVQLGGKIDDSELIVEQAPQFVRGEKVLVFVREMSAGPGVVGWFQGKFPVKGAMIGWSNVTLADFIGRIEYVMEHEEEPPGSSWSELGIPPGPSRGRPAITEHAEPDSAEEEQGESSEDVIEVVPPPEPLPTTPCPAHTRGATAAEDTSDDQRHRPRPHSDNPTAPQLPDAVSESGALTEPVPFVPDVIGPSADVHRWVRGIYPEAREILGKRGTITKHFDNGDGSKICAVGGQYHYKDESGQWQDIDLTVRESTAGSTYGYECITNSFESYFPAVSGDKGFLMAAEDARLEIWSAPEMAVIVPDGPTLSVSGALPVAARPSANSLYYDGVYPDVDEEFLVMADGVKHNMTLHRLPDGVREGTVLTFAGTVQLPEGAVVLADGSQGPDAFTADSFSVGPAPGTTHSPFTFGRPLVFDSTLDQAAAEFLAFAPQDKLTPEQQEQKQHLLLTGYSVDRDQDQLRVGILVSGDWLAAEDTTFPITIDPYVIIGTGTSLYRHPWDIFYNYARSQSIYRSTELGFSGTITALYYYRDAIATAYSMENSQLWMRDTSSSTLSSWQTEGTTVLGPSTWNIGIEEGWYGFTLTTPFEHNNSYNLQISFRHQDGSYSIPYHKYRCTTTSPYYRTLEGHSDSTNPPAVSQHYYRPNAYIVYTEPPDPCDSITSIGGCGSAYTQTYSKSGLGAWSTSFCGYGTPGQEQVYSFVAPTTGTYSIQVTSANGYVDYGWRAGSCAETGWTCIDDISSPGTYGSMSWSAATTYYLLLDAESTSSRTHQFYINCPPVNQDPDVDFVSLDVDANVLYAGQTYQLITDHTDPDGQADVDYAYAGIGFDGGWEIYFYYDYDGSSYGIGAGSAYVTLDSVNKTSISDGWRMTWTFTMDWDWAAADDSGNVDPVAQTTDDAEAFVALYWNYNYDHENDVRVSSVNYTSTQEPDTWFTVSGYLDYDGVTTPNPPNMFDVRIDPDWTGTNYDDYDLGSTAYYFISVLSPSGAGNYTFDVDIINAPAGAGTTSANGNPLTVEVLAPSITSIFPTSGGAGERAFTSPPSAYTSTYTIDGDHFGVSQGANDYVFFFQKTGSVVGIHAWIDSWSDTQITGWVPTGASSHAADGVYVYKDGLWSNSEPFEVTHSIWGYRWDDADMPVPYYYNPANQEGGSTAAIEGQVQISHQTWQDVAGAYITMQYMGTTANAASNHGDGLNTVGWSDGAGWVGLCTILPAGTDITEADVEFNTDYDWAIGAAAGSYDIQSICSHEMGHGFGGQADQYGDPDSPETMYGYAAENDTSKRSLEPEDEDGAQWLYPASCTGPTGEWCGAYNTDWNHAGNWNNGLLPDSGTDVTIPSAVANWPHVQDEGMTCGSLTVDYGAYLYVDSGPYSLWVYGDVSNNGTVTMDGTYLNDVSIVGDHTLSGTGTWTNGCLGVYNGTCTLGSNVNLSSVIAFYSPYDGTLSVGPYTLTVTGHMYNSGTVNVTTGTINVGGNWTHYSTYTPVSFNCGTGTTCFTGGSASFIYDSPTFYDVAVDKTGGSVYTYAGSSLAIANCLSIETGTMSANGYTIDVNGPSSSGDAVTVGDALGSNDAYLALASGAINVNASVSGIRALHIQSDGQLDLGGSGAFNRDIALSDDYYECLRVDSGAVYNQTGGTFTLDNNTSSYWWGITIDAGGEFNMSGGTFYNDNTAFCYGAMDFDGGTYYAATSAAESSAELRVYSGGRIEARNTTFTRFGSSSSGGVLVESGAQVGTSSGDDSDDFDNCAFADGPNGGSLITVSSDETFSVTGTDWTLGDASYNVHKPNDAGDVSACNATGSGAGEAYENDPYGRVHWDPAAPSSAWASHDNFCSGAYATIELSASGGVGETLEWYSGSCGGTHVGTGNPATITAPTSTTSYYGRWENSCGASACAPPVTVTVIPNGGACGDQSDTDCDNPDTCWSGACEENYEAYGFPCLDDGNDCTDDVCDGAGSCTHPNNAAPCDDGVFCNGADTCSGGSCVLHAGYPCAGDEWCDESGDVCVGHGNGDSEPDGDVDLVDFRAFQLCFGQSALGGCEPANMTGEDDMIDLDDYDEFASVMGGP